MIETTPQEVREAIFAAIEHEKGRERQVRRIRRQLGRRDLVLRAQTDGYVVACRYTMMCVLFSPSLDAVEEWVAQTRKRRPGEVRRDGAAYTTVSRRAGAYDPCAAAVKTA